MKIKRERGRYIQLFLFIFILLFPFSGCNLFISLIDNAKPEPTPIPPAPTDPPEIIITGLSDAGIIYTGDAAVVIESGDYLYTAGWNAEPDNFCVVNFSKPLAPEILGRMSVGNAYGITAHGQYAYVETQGGGESPSSGVLAIDCTDPNNPWAPDWETDGFYSAYQIYYDNGYLFNCSEGLVSFYNVTTPADIVYLNELSAFNAEWGAIQDNYFYFTERTDPGKLKIYNISEPSSPGLTANFTISAYPGGIAVDGDYAFIAFNDISRSVSAYDISNPSLPRKINSISLITGTSNNFFEMKIDNHHLFICGDDDLFVVDVRDPYAMSEVTFIHTSDTGSSNGFAISGDYAIVSDNTLYRVFHIEKEIAEPTPEPTPEPPSYLTNWSFDDPGYYDYPGTFSATPVPDTIPGWDLSAGVSIGCAYNIGINTGNDPEAQSNYLYLAQEGGIELSLSMSASQDINYEITSSSKLVIKFKIINYNNDCGSSDHYLLEYPVRVAATIDGASYNIYLRSNIAAIGEEDADLNIWIEDEVILDGRTAYGAKSATHVIQAGDIFTNVSITPCGTLFGVYFEYIDFRE